MNHKEKPQVWFWIVVSVFLLWNIMGISAWLVEVFSPEFMTQKMTAAQQQLYVDRPGWYLYVYGIAVFTGALACILLLARSKNAVLYALISLAAVMITTSYNILADVITSLAVADLFFFIAVPLFSIALWLLARWFRLKNWIG